MRTVSMIAVAAALWNAAFAQVEEQHSPQHSGSSVQDRFKEYDKNGDGKITTDELGMPVVFKAADKNGDGAMLPDEFAAYLTARRGRVGRIAPAAGTRRGESRPARATGSPSPAASAGTATTMDIRYAEGPPGVDANPLSLDIYSPKNAKDLPVMIYIHGGGWRKGDKSAVGLKAEYFTSKGWIFVSVNYRLVPDGQHPKNVEDVAAAIAWVHDNISKRGGDPEKLFIMGHSAGAHLVALVATDEHPLKKAGKPLSVIKGVIPLDTQAYDVPKQVAESITATYGEVFGKDDAMQRDASPIHHIARDKGIPPFLIFYSSGMGDQPNSTRPVRANAFADALKKAGVPAEVVDASDRNHGQINQRFGDPSDTKVTGKAEAFLNGILGKKKSRPHTSLTVSAGNPR